MCFLFIINILTKHLIVEPVVTILSKYVYNCHFVRAASCHAFLLSYVSNNVLNEVTLSGFSLSFGEVSVVYDLFWSPLQWPYFDVHLKIIKRLSISTLG